MCISHCIHLMNYHVHVCSRDSQHCWTTATVVMCLTIPVANGWTSLRNSDMVSVTGGERKVSTKSWISLELPWYMYMYIQILPKTAQAHFNCLERIVLKCLWGLRSEMHMFNPVLKAGHPVFLLQSMYMYVVHVRLVCIVWFVEVRFLGFFLFFLLLFCQCAIHMFLSCTDIFPSGGSHQTLQWVRSQMQLWHLC